MSHKKQWTSKYSRRTFINTPQKTIRTVNLQVYIQNLEIIFQNLRRIKDR